MSSEPVGIAILGTRGLPARYGGRETATEEIGRRLVREGRTVVVYGRNSNGPPPRPSEFEGIQLVHLPAPPGKGIDSLGHLLLSAFRVVFDRRVRVVVLSDVGTSVVAPWLRLFGRKTVWWVDGPAWERAKWGVLGRSYLRFASWFGARASQEMITDSRVAQRHYQARHGRDSHYIPYGSTLEAGDAVEVLRELGVQPGKYILFVGRLTPEKGVHTLVRAHHDLDTDVPLVIVGDNPYDREYVASLRGAASSSAVFAGYRFGESFHTLMRHCQIYVQPSEVEGTSPVLLSALGYGRPVIVHGIEENLETIGDAGASFRGGPDALREELRRLVDDPERCRRLGEAAVERVREFYDWDQIARQFAAVCDGTVSGQLDEPPSSSSRR